ncbi:U2 putative protein [Bangoran virus]|uniref:U2 putative protein n=1 Tax=Bangoran virus TaxID=864693 RepID=UPI0024820F37|nr:U2 putative protein [Bangoran virus]UAX43319.1 U2 putative protein [Bangoran virus]
MSNSNQYHILKVQSAIPSIHSVVIRNSKILVDCQVQFIWEGSELDQRSILMIIREELKKHPNYKSYSNVILPSVGLALSQSFYDYKGDGQNYLTGKVFENIEIPCVQYRYGDQEELDYKIDSSGIFMYTRWNLIVNLHVSFHTTENGKTIWEIWYQFTNSRPIFCRFEIEDVASSFGFEHQI